MKIVWWIIGILVLLVVFPFVILLIKMIFIDKLSIAKVRLSNDILDHNPNIQIEELSNTDAQIITEFMPSDGDLPVAKEFLMTPEGELRDELHVFDDENRTVLVFKLKDTDTTLVFLDNTIHLQQDHKLGELIHTFKNPVMKSIWFVNYVNTDTILMIANPDTQKHVDTKLYQVNLKTFEKTLLSKNPYYCSNRPPKLLKPEGLDGSIAIYYSGTVSFGFGGHSSRPEISTVRIYNKQYLQGHDIASFTYKAGTITHAKIEGDKLILTGDPSRPITCDNYEKPARFWQITFL
ncbi:hypothetical protein Q4566_14870 [Tamlana sp. 2_MG-2023]|uniref:hypothetical protein n=1 Tax=unclassified Tamlana TaxID=2614803 RepID=UPI0026E401C7|nr:MULTISPECIES: hypothetical protein [unclassified Tamlana]MDO6761492.1 hypothetical protein [Tamlana sp. 2_MG-2023]MDO6792333.1 hypothetical protein [Tamlana sp. 1_MG-2023]